MLGAQIYIKKHFKTLKNLKKGGGVVTQLGGGVQLGGLYPPP